MSIHDEEAIGRFLRNQWDSVKIELALSRLERLVLATETPQINLKTLPAVGRVTATTDMLLEIKASDDTQGIVEGYLSTFGNEDLGHDIVDKGAFSESLKAATAFARQHGSSAIYPLLWQHDKDEPIGGITNAREDIHGLRIQAQLNLGIERGRQAYHALKHGYMAFSIGYRPTQYQYVGSVRHLKQIDLREGSVVTYPMNQEARATGAKWEQSS
jgi:hypothetical protein